MSKNKLTTEEQFLTLEQAKELQELGVDIYGNFEIDIDDNGFETIEKVGTFASDTFEYYKKSIPTLSVAEMIEMLPKVFIGNLNSMWFLEITCKATHKDYQVRYIVSDFPRIEFRRTLIRDALFEMLKWLKQNKLM